MLKKKKMLQLYITSNIIQTLLRIIYVLFLNLILFKIKIIGVKTLLKMYYYFIL